MKNFYAFKYNIKTGSSLWGDLSPMCSYHVGRYSLAEYWTSWISSLKYFTFSIQVDSNHYWRLKVCLVTVFHQEQKDRDEILMLIRILMCQFTRMLLGHLK